MKDRSETSSRSPWGSRLTLVVLFLVFLAPAGGAWLWFKFGSDFSTRNYGSLYDPARPLESISFESAGGEAAGFADLRTSWVLVYAGEGSCDDACLAQVDKMRRVRISLAKNVKRIRLLYLSAESPRPQALERLHEMLPEGVIARLDEAALTALRATLQHDGETTGAVWNRIYLIDPIGNLVLSYEPDAEPARMRKDLSRLLHASQIG